MCRSPKSTCLSGVTAFWGTVRDLIGPPWLGLGQGDLRSRGRASLGAWACPGRGDCSEGGQGQEGGGEGGRWRGEKAERTRSLSREWGWPEPASLEGPSRSSAFSCTTCEGEAGEAKATQLLALRLGVHLTPALCTCTYQGSPSSCPTRPALTPNKSWPSGSPLHAQISGFQLSPGSLFSPFTGEHEWAGQVGGGPGGHALWVFIPPALYLLCDLGQLSEAPGPQTPPLCDGWAWGCARPWLAGPGRAWVSLIGLLGCSPPGPQLSVPRGSQVPSHGDHRPSLSWGKGDCQAPTSESRPLRLSLRLLLQGGPPPLPITARCAHRGLESRPTVCGSSPFYKSAPMQRERCDNCSPTNCAPPSLQTETKGGGVSRGAAPALSGLLGPQEPPGFRNTREPCPLP